MAKLGEVVKDGITGFEGVVIGRTEWLRGPVRLITQSRLLDKGLPLYPQALDELTCTVVGQGVAPQPPMTTTAKVGDIVKDNITDFEGAVIARTDWLNGSVDFMIQSKTMHNGVPVKLRSVNAAGVVVVSEGAFRPATSEKASAVGG